jgi:hypothetical protein
MADTKISALTSATTPLAGTEVLPIVQSSTTVKVSVANLTAGRAVSMLSGTISSGNLEFSTTGQRITGDFNNGTVTNRVLFQNSTVNDNTIVGALPNGTATISGFVAYALSTAANSSTLDLLVRNDAANAVQIRSNRQGTGTFLPMQFFTSGGKKFEIDTSGNATVTTAAGLGYSTGAGGTVTQATSRTTGVTLNKPTGAITMFSDLGSAVAATFTVTNSLVAATDTILLSQQSGTNLYVLLVTAVAAGSFNITFYTTGGVATDAPVINFSLIKGATS